VHDPEIMGCRCGRVFKMGAVNLNFELKIRIKINQVFAANIQLKMAYIKNL
jgi:hypothetical protein